jgi:beta-glucosidase
MTPGARLVFPALRWRNGSFAHERGRIEAALAAGVGGFILFGGTTAAVAALTRTLRDLAGRPLLIGADLERGAAQQVRGLTDLPPPAALGAIDDLEATAAAGIVTAAEAAAVGINWVFAPVCDLDNEPANPIVQTRAFGADPGRVAAHAVAWVRGCQEHGVLACVKHYPGHGRTTLDSHEGLPNVAAGRGELEGTDLAPFAAAVTAGVGSVMAAFVSYSGWDSGGRAAGFSPRILGWLRERGFDGVTVTDALIMGGALAAEAEPGAAVRAVRAGCDALLYPRDFAGVIRALDAAVGTELPAPRMEEALARVTAAQARWARPAVTADQLDLASHGAFADGLADRALAVWRGAPPRIAGPLRIAIVDDDVGGPYAVGPRDVFARTLREAGVTVGGTGKGEGRRVVLVYAEPRSWKGRAFLGERSLARLRTLAPGARLVVLFGHPRLTAQIPAGPPVLGAWHGQPLMQRAAARWVLARR